MSGLFGSLSNGVKALNAHSRAIEAAGRNLANVNNPEYSRQRVQFGDRGTVQTPLGAQSLGLEAIAIQQLRDTLLDQQVMREKSATAALTAEEAGYQKAQAALGQSIDRSAATDGTAVSQGITGSITDFFNAFESFSARPTDVGERQTLVQKASILAEKLNITDGRLAQVQTDLDAAVNQDVSEANRLLSTIAELNGQIGRLEVNAAGSAVDLRDQRQARLEELSKLVKFETRNNASNSGQLDLYMFDAAGAEVPLVTLATVPNSISFDGTDVKAGTTVVDLAGGSIKGSLTARDGAVQTLRDQLDRVATQLVASVNAAYNPTGSSTNFFNPAGTDAGSIKIATGLTATTLRASDGGEAADNTIARAVARLADRSFSTTGAPADQFDGTFSQFITGTVSEFGQALSGVTSRLADQTNIETLVSGQRDAVSGVSLDEEMADLLKFQRAFQASSRVIQVIDDLLESVINLGR